jgi:hypothetical protein
MRTVCVGLRVRAGELDPWTAVIGRIACNRQSTILKVQFANWCVARVQFDGGASKGVPSDVSTLCCSKLSYMYRKQGRHN